MARSYDVNVKNCETYENIVIDDIMVKDSPEYELDVAAMELDAKETALARFQGDDEWIGSEEAESATIDDCEIVFEEEM